VVLEGVNVVYEGERIPAIHDIDLTVSAGEFVTVVGPNGAGKTTLLEAINGLLPVTKGRARVLGMEVARGGEAVRKRVGYVVQNFSIDPLDPFLCRDVVMMGRTGRIGLMRFPSKEDWKAVDGALEAMGMSAFAKRPIGKLSGGEFQKILLARTMAQDPDLLLLDEPFANLDVDARAEAQGAINAWRGAGDLTVVMVSHDISGVPASCDRIVVIDKGRLVMDGGRDEVLDSPQMGQLFGSLGCCRD
jgi:zinc/manganese transport system ATP-binding protein